MRIRVFLPKLKECDEELFQETRKILGLMDDVDSVISGLRSLSGMGAVIRRDPAVEGQNAGAVHIHDDDGTGAGTDTDAADG